MNTTRASVTASGNQEFRSNSERQIEPVDFGTTGQLFDGIRDFFATHPGLTNESVLKLTYFIFAIQFPERCNIWPCATVVAPDTVGSSRLLRMVASLCAHPIQVGEITLDAVLSLPQSQRPTLLLIDQLAASRELEHVLRIMSRPGSPIIRKGKSYDVSIPTFVCTAEPLRDRWILDQALQIVLTPTRGSLPNLDPQMLTETARKLKGELILYRDVSLAKIRVSHFDVPQFSSPTREIAKMLGSCVLDETLQRALPMLLDPQDRDLRTRTTDSIQAVEIEAALFLSHEIIGRKVRVGEASVSEEVFRPEARVGEIADIANGILKGRGESMWLEPREVGNHMRALGIFSERLGRAGRGIRFTNELRRKIHELARAYDVRSTLDNALCEFCAGSRIEK